MRSIGLIGSLAAMFVGAPLAAQGINFRTDGGILSRDGAAERGVQGRSRGKIPPGHLPPAGMCRIWIDGVPPGRQPAPTDCQTAVATKPANARVIWGDQTPFPGKGKNKAKASDRDDDRDKKAKKNKGKMKDRQDRDDDDDEEIGRNAGSSRWPVIGGVATSERGSKSQKRGGRK